MKHKFRPALLGICLSFGVLAACRTQTPGVQQPVRRVVSAEETAEGIEVAVAGENLLLKKGVHVTADSQESDAFKAAYAVDGIADDDELRWSSENDWEDSEHWLQVKFGQETEIGFVKIFWERTNACVYTLEYSLDGKSWNTAVAFENASDEKEQNICLEEPVTAKYLRIHVTDVTRKEADLSLYYQNVSILELEVYGPLQDRFVISRPQIDSGYDRKLVLPEVPEGYELAFGGADYENLLTIDGQIADTLSAVTVESGFILKKEGESWELPGMLVEIPASTAQKEAAVQELPVPVQEWCAGEKCWNYPETLLMTVEEAAQELLADTAAVFLQELSDSELFSEVLGQGANMDDSAEKASLNARIHLSLLNDSSNSLGEEGYEICVEETQIEIRANTVQGIRWGCVTMLEWLKLENSSAALPTGTIRDYPAYPVRGFGIDVGRRAISMDLLYRIVEELSARKMNTLQIHLNDNQIIAQSEYDGTVAGARSLYAGFRLESELKNKSGESITSSDLYYTKEAFRQLIADAAAYGVEIVPEIDTPAHSLALTKVFPEYGFSRDPESVDQLDLSKEGARQLAKDIWSEYLTAGKQGQDSVFGSCSALHLGMDEYYGKDSAYIAYLQELSAFVERLAPEKELRIWGSLSRVDEDYSGVSRNLQMHVWDTDWADPEDMYNAGFSIINSLSSRLYIIPGGGYDTLNTEFLEKEWQPNLFQTVERDWELPAWSDRMLGACYMMWNDWTWANGDELTEDDLFGRFKEPLPVLARKLWGEHR